MKKVLLVMFALICFGMTANAQSCTIQGANDGSTIMVTNDWKDGSTIHVNLSNDSEKTCANVTVKVEVKYVYKGNMVVGGPGATTETFEGHGKSCPTQDCEIKIPINETKQSNVFHSYKIIGVSGNKCN